ncbi:MAG: hypothetical protein ABIG44_02675 [Planctomycetota bacterium]
MTCLLAGGAVWAGLCLAWPLAGTLGETLTSTQWAEAMIGPRRLGLLTRGGIIALASAALAQILGTGLAAGMIGARASIQRGVTIWLGLVVLLTPPYIYAYAWSLLLLPGGVMVGATGALQWPPWLVHEGRAIWCLGTWLTPVAAVLLASGWRIAGRSAYTLTLPDATPLRALWRGAAGAMSPWLLVSMIACTLLSSTEHTVCDLCQAPTWNTELLAEIQNRRVPAGLLAWPQMAIVGFLLLGLWPFRNRLRQSLHDLADWDAADEVGGRMKPWGHVTRLLATSGVCVLLLLPMLILLGNLREVDALARTWISFPHEWPDGLLCAGGCVIISAWLALAVDYILTHPRRHIIPRLVCKLVIALALIAAILPPAVIGDAFLVAYLKWPIISDYWPVLSITTAARFVIIMILALRISGRGRGMDLSSVATTDGADWAGAYLRVRLPLCLPALGGAAVIVGLLALLEVPASLLVRPPGLESVALTLFNHMHYGRADEIVALSLYVLLFVALGVGGWGLLRRATVRE